MKKLMKWIERNESIITAFVVYLLILATLSFWGYINSF